MSRPFDCVCGDLPRMIVVPDRRLTLGELSMLARMIVRRRTTTATLVGLFILAVSMIGPQSRAVAQTNRKRDRNAEPVTYAVVTADNVYVRAGAGDSYYPFGKVQKGYVGSLSILRNGSRTIRRDSLKTRAGWSPFEGCSFSGRVSHTVVRGKVYPHVED